MSEEMKEASEELENIRCKLNSGHRYQLSHSINHLIHDLLDRMHDTTAELLDKDDQNDRACLDLLLEQSHELYKLIRIRMDL